MKNKSLIFVLFVAVIAFTLVYALLLGVVKPVTVVVAKLDMAAGTRLDASLLTTRSLPAEAVPAGAYRTIAEAEGKVLSVSRVAGDIITDYVAGESDISGIPAQLEANTVAISIKVDQATGLAGMVRPGQYVTAIGIVDPQKISQRQTASVNAALDQPVTGATPAPTPTSQPPVSPASRIAVTGLKVLVVPQSFRYEELPKSSSEEALFSSARTSMSQGSVILLQASILPVEIAPGLTASPAELLALLNQTAVIQLVLEPASGLNIDQSILYGVDLARLYQAITGIRLTP